MGKTRPNYTCDSSKLRLFTLWEAQFITTGIITLRVLRAFGNYATYPSPLPFGKDAKLVIASATRSQSPFSLASPRELLQSQPQSFLHVIRRILWNGLDGRLCLNHRISQRSQRGQHLGIAIGHGGNLF